MKTLWYLLWRAWINIQATLKTCWSLILLLGRQEFNMDFWLTILGLSFVLSFCTLLIPASGASWWWYVLVNLPLWILFPFALVRPIYWFCELVKDAAEYVNEQKK